jgi:putative protease
VYTGKITNYFTNLGVAEVKLETGGIRLGDEIIITGPTTGVFQSVIDEIRVELESVDEAVKGEYCSIPVNQKLRRSDKLYKVVDSSAIKAQ